MVRTAWRPCSALPAPSAQSFSTAHWPAHSSGVRCWVCLLSAASVAPAAPSTSRGQSSSASHWPAHSARLLSMAGLLSMAPVALTKRAKGTVPEVTATPKGVLGGPGGSCHQATTLGSRPRQHPSACAPRRRAGWRAHSTRRHRTDHAQQGGTIVGRHHPSLWRHSLVARLAPCWGRPPCTWGQMKVWRHHPFCRLILHCRLILSANDPNMFSIEDDVWCEAPCAVPSGKPPPGGHLLLHHVVGTVAVTPSHTTMLDRKKIPATKNLARKDPAGHVGRRR